MLVYRTPTRAVPPRTCLTRCLDRLERRRLSHADTVALLIELGDLETAAVDGLSPDADGMTPGADSTAAAAWRAASEAAAVLFHRSWHGTPLPPEPLRAALRRLLTGPLPERLVVTVPEGYAYYALYPETYLLAAERFVREARPHRVVCVGLRSIGTSLSAVVAAAVAAAGFPVESLTVRPRGPPFDRHLTLTPALAAHLRAGAEAGAHALVVDEGPGLSGSSLTGAAAALSERGFADDRIVLFPSWLPDPAGFRSPRARERWPRHAKYHTPLRAVRPWDGWRDLSGGAWRDGAFAGEADWPAVQPQHERIKYLGPHDGGPGMALHKFAGLGAHGDARRALAERLAAAGFGPPVLGLDDGFLVQPFLPGRPLRAADAGPDLLRAATGYLAFRRRHLATGAAAAPADLLAMIETNLREGLGPAALDRLAGLDRTLARWPEVPAVAIDGRLQPHEWRLTPTGLIKTDGVDHHDDHFLPGPQDIAWDVAGLAVEFDLSDAAERAVAAAVADVSGDTFLPHRLPVHRLGYLALRLGYATLAAETLGATPDGARMAALARRYRRKLTPALARL